MLVSDMFDNARRYLWMTCRERSNHFSLIFLIVQHIGLEYAKDFHSSNHYGPLLRFYCEASTEKSDSHITRSMRPIRPSDELLDENSMDQLLYMN